jgi:hypothetical protein
MERTEALDRECCELDTALRTTRLDLSRERAAVASLQQELSDVSTCVMYTATCANYTPNMPIH